MKTVGIELSLSKKELVTFRTYSYSIRNYLHKENNVCRNNVVNTELGNKG